MRRPAIQTAGVLAVDLRGIHKRFGPVLALDDVSFSVASGSVHALLGENGAGKSTLMRIAYGLERRDSGTLTLFGRAISAHSVATARAAGVGMVHQHLSLSPSLTALENFVLGGSGLYSRRDAHVKYDAVSRQFGITVEPHARVRDLSIVQQQRLEILKALGRDARLLILDEPTAVLAPAEVDDLLRWLRSFADAGGAVVLVTHKLPEALRAADAVTVLRRGRVTFAAAAAETSADALAGAMFPDRADSGAAAPPQWTTGATVVAARAVRVDDNRGVARIREASFDIRAGEVVGLAGVEDSGVRDLVHALAGITRIQSGTLQLPRRMGFIPADRQRDGLIPDFSLTDNVALRGAGARRGLMAWTQLAAHTAHLLADYGVVPRVPSMPARQLSGGNQQRVVVARELDGSTDLLVADNPTRGLDMQASDFVLRRLVQSAANGTAVVVHSSDLDEVLSIASRVLVVFDGQVREVPRDRDSVGRAMLGA